MGRYRAARRRRSRIAVGIVAVTLVGAGLTYAVWLGPRPGTGEPAAAAVAAEPLPAPPSGPGDASPVAPRAQDARWLELDAAWRAGGLPEPPDGWLQAYARLTAGPCARLELEGRSGSLIAHVIAPDAAQAARLESMAKEVPGAIAVEREVIAPESALCRLLDLLNRATLPSPTRLARLGEPLGDRCGMPPCYAGVEAARLREGERLVLAVTTPPVASHMTVALIRPDGVVAQLYPPAQGLAAAASSGPAVSLPAGDALWIGDPRAGAAYVERPVEAPFGRSHVLVLAAAAPLFPQPPPAAQPLEPYLATLAAAFAAQPGPARPLASLLGFEIVPLQP